VTPHDLIAAFETIADSPEGINRLRELVLQLAMRGKLVPQNLKDHPADLLLEQVAKERARLVKTGKLGANKPQSPVTKEEVAFEIPSSWRWSRFGAICDTRLGKMLDKAKNSGNLRPYLRNANLQWFRFDLTNVLELRLEDAEVEEHSVRVGDLVICEGGEPGRAAVCDESVAGMAFQKALHRARPFCGINPTFLAYLLRCDTWAGRLDTRFTGATIQHFTGQALREYPVPLPPLAEQHRIVARVDELMGLLDRLEAAHHASHGTRTAARDAALAALREAGDSEKVEVAWNRVSGRLHDLCVGPQDVKPLRDAVLELAVRGRLVQQDPSDEPARILLESIAVEKARMTSGMKAGKEYPLLPDVETKPHAIPPSWAWSPLRSLCMVFEDCLHKTPTYVDDGACPAIRPRDVTGGVLNLAQALRVSPEVCAEQNRKHAPTAGDIAYSRELSLGWAAEIPPATQLCLSQGMMVMRPSSRISSSYFTMLLNGPAGRRQAIDEAVGAAHLHLNVRDIAAFVFPIPPLAEQYRIVAKVDELMGLLDRLEERLLAAQGTQAAFAAAAVNNLDT
jgi:type I restriction enzyme, S subunit